MAKKLRQTLRSAEGCSLMQPLYFMASIRDEPAIQPLLESGVEIEKKIFLRIEHHTQRSTTCMRR